MSERKALLEGLRDIPFLQPFPSQANFVLCKVRGFCKAQNTVAV